ncbi:protein translocase subunit SecD [Nocardioides flavescens]|uniref:Protein translocase subunit SecD n=1 Tax=Nocardioides flavescens TaxID=2691959 RepID=A0A6L7F0Z8_9ACTN|nr:protein translocase subunit SecD [Nocardioides flavescens]MXG90679.1 protein translocase subunit SecD [Nocardioides flavescens]
MARRTARPGRTLVSFFIGLAIAFGLVALTGTWKPELGLDLQGGTRITLIAKGNPTSENLEEARSIIDQRVNGSGVSEAEVVAEGSDVIVVEIPGDSRRDLTETVERQAQLRFRVVACSDLDPTLCAGGATATDPTVPGSDTTTDPGAGVIAPSATPSADATTGPSDAAPSTDASSAPSDATSGAASDAATPSGSANRAPARYATSDQASETASPSAEPSASASASASASTEPSDGATAGTTDEANTPIPAPDGGPDVADPLTWINAPNQAAIDAYNAFTCPQDGSPVNVEDDPAKPLVSCQWDPDAQVATKYLLSAAMIEGSELDSADAVIPQSQVNYVVQLDFNGAGTKAFTEISRALVNTDKQFGVVLDGQVISAPQMNALITNGQPQIEGGFTQESAQSLATSLRYGALPIAFEDPSTETIGPSLAGDQLRAGLIAGAFGLGLVLIYCLIYYRGLGLVVVSSLLAAAALTYALVLLLSKTAGFTLTLPGIAGLIIAVGVTADSFIIFFERIRDEMREGKTMRVAVETGWKRAKVTRLAAQVVSLLSAAVLYIFATGAVKGFGFALGLSTLVDLAILFWFTKPMVSWLARFHFFNSGSRFSGLSRETLGMDGPAAPAARRTSAPAGGKA